MRGPRDEAIGRLTKRAEFLAAASGRRFHTERMTVQGLRRPDPATDRMTVQDRLRTEAGGLRFGFTVTKKVGHAVARNRIKRRLRAAALDAGAGHADMALDVVVIGRRSALTADYGLLVADLNRALQIVSKPATRWPSPSSSPTGDAGRGRLHD